ncbi:MAG: P1 family peptidase [Clostridiaceae bacterium]|nr:P1 family peptidase [Clostridiaceae bacterium]
MQKRICEYGFNIGHMKKGDLNKITDVEGVTVGHCTIDTESSKTGVTVIMPCPDNPFARKLTAAAFVHNGFGKTQGIPQIEELGTLETPIALTNTLNIGKVHDAITGYMLERCKEDGIKCTSINPVIGECNDSVLNDISIRAVDGEHVLKAIQCSCRSFEEGSVGAGKGTVCFGLKGGIGSASRIMEIGGKCYTLGVLVQSNFGATENLTLCGHEIGPMLKEKITSTELDRGSIMMIIATDLPLSSRQLKRVIKRAGVGLNRCGSFMGHGSGDIMIGFTTSNRIETADDTQQMTIIREDLISNAFTACAESTEEAVLNSLAMAETTRGFDGTVKYSLTDIYLKNL